MLKKHFAALVIFVFLLALCSAGCSNGGSNNTTSTAPMSGSSGSTSGSSSSSSGSSSSSSSSGGAAPRIQCVTNITNPGASIRTGDWFKVIGESFGTTQGTGAVTFNDGTNDIPVELYFQWFDDAIYCRMPGRASGGGGIVGEELDLTVTTASGVRGAALEIPYDEVPNPDPMPTPPLIRKQPYIIYENENTKMIIAWQTIATPGAAIIKWGPTAACDQGQAIVMETGSGQEDHQFFYTITGLGPDTLTYYRVIVDGADGKAYTGSFRTAPSANATALTFYGYGDTRDGISYMNATLNWLGKDVQQDAASRQTFCLHNGDFVSKGLGEPYWDSQYFNSSYPDTMAFLSSMPVIASLGNHECYDMSAIGVEAPDGGKLVRKYFPYVMYPTEYFYYSFDYGPLHVACVDPYRADYASGSAQVNWLDADLANSTKPWKIVMLHPPLYCATSPDSRDDRLRESIEPIIIRRNIKLVVQGHQHYYSRSVKDGVTYLVLGGGGGPLTQPDPHMPYLVYAKSCYHFARFQIAGNAMNIMAIDNSGNLVEQAPTIYNNN